MNTQTKNRARKKILIGIEAAAGGTIKHVVYLASSLNKEAFEVTVVYSDLRDEPKLDFYLKEMMTNGIEMKRIKMHRSIHLIKDLVSFIKILAHINHRRYDIVHAHSSKAGILFRLAGWICKIPLIVYTPHCFYFQSLKGIKRRFFVLIEKLGSFISDKIVLSEVEMLAAKRFHIAPGRKLCNINNAIPFLDSDLKGHLLEHNYLREQLGIRSKYIVGGVGRLAPQKGWIDLIKAAKYVVRTNPQVTFLIVGTGRQKHQLLKLIAQLNLEKHVMLTGYIFDPKYVYQNIDLFVSTSHWEGLPYTILEATSFKKAIVATNLGYPEDLIDNRCLVKVGDYQDMAEKILDLLSNEKLRREIAEKSHMEIKKCYNYENFVRRHEDLYK